MLNKCLEYIIHACIFIIIQGPKIRVSNEVPPLSSKALGSDLLFIDLVADIYWHEYECEYFTAFYDDGREEDLAKL